jgi:hypothetical protein
MVRGFARPARRHGRCSLPLAMMASALAILFGLFMSVLLAACMDEGSQGPADMAVAASHDMAGTIHDFAQTGGGDGGLKALCQVCTSGTECQSGYCLPYMNGAIKLCSHSCSAATASTDCPGIGACNGMNNCKCP